MGFGTYADQAGIIPWNPPVAKVDLRTDPNDPTLYDGGADFDADYSSAQFPAVTLDGTFDPVICEIEVPDSLLNHGIEHAHGLCGFHCALLLRLRGLIPFGGDDNEDNLQLFHATS